MKDVKKNLQDHDFKLKKKFGQNFITNPQVLEEIVEKSQVSNQDIVVEIGPGSGALTAKLAERVKFVVAIEIDTSLEPILKQNLSPYPNIKVIFADILKWDLKSYLLENYPGQSIKVVANLPYYITSPILMKLLEEKIPLRTITIMVQKEVADRMQASPGGKDYGALTLAVAYYAKAKLVMTVPPHVFLPAPKVTSGVVHLQVKNPNLWISSDQINQPVDEKQTMGALLTEKEEKELLGLIKAAFEQRRKTLINALANKGLAHKDKIKEALDQMGLSHNIRGECLGLEEFIKLSHLVHQ